MERRTGRRGKIQATFELFSALKIFGVIGHFLPQKWLSSVKNQLDFVTINKKLKILICWSDGNIHEE